jgi:hypothetical protein
MVAVISMDELLVLIIKLIIRGIGSASAPKPMLGAPKSITPAPPVGKPAAAPAHRAPLSAKGNPAASRSAPARPVAIPAGRGRRIVDGPPMEPVARTGSLPAQASPSSQIAEALRSRKNLATAMVMTELLMKPVALRRADSN